MNSKMTQRDEGIIQNCLQSIRNLPGFQVDFTLKKLGGPFAGAIKIKGEWGEKYYYLKVLPQLTPAVAELVMHQLKTTPAPANCAPLLLTHYVSPNLAAKLKEKGFEFSDCAGNLLLRNSPLYVEIAGQKHPPQGTGLDRLFRPAGLKLIYLFLRNRQAVNASYRVLADDAGIALGAIGTLLGELENRGNLIKTESGRELIEAEELLQRWQLGYLETLRPRMLLQRCSLSEAYDLAQLPELIQRSNQASHIILGGDLGARLLCDKNTAAQSAALYLPAALQLKMMLQLHLTPDSEGNVTLLKPFGSLNLWHRTQADGINLVDPLLIYAELASLSQERKIMEKLYAQYILPRLADEN